MKKTDNRLNYLIVAAIILTIGGLVFGLASTDNQSGQDKNSDAESGTPRLSVDLNRFDFGDVSMARGKVNHSFNIKNQGDGYLTISNISTSCMCTSASLTVNGKTSPTFGMPGHGANFSFWSEKLKPGEEAELEVVFDPNAHGPNATGPITRVITLLSDDGSQKDSKTTLTITANVVK